MHRTDPDATLYKKSAGKGFQLCHMAHVAMENRNLLPISGRVTEAITQGEWDAALEMLGAVSRQGATVGADTGYDNKYFVEGVRALGMTPHVAQYTKRASNIDGRTTRHEGYEVEEYPGKRKGIEQIFGFIKTTGMLRKVRHRGRAL